MVRLMKLNTTIEATSSFDVNFNESITLRPNSRIALQNLICEFLPDDIVIDNVNAQMIIKSGTAPNRNVQVTQGVYDINGFLKELNRAFNACLGFDDTTSGVYKFNPPASPFTGNKWEWKIILNQTVPYPLNIQYAYVGSDQNDPTVIGYDAGKLQMTNNIYRKVSTTADDTWDYFYQKPIFSNGTGEVSCFVTADAGSPTNFDGIMVGLYSSALPDINVSTISPQDCFCSIYIESGNIHYHVNSGDFDSGVAAAAAQLLLIELQQGSINLKYCRQSANDTYNDANFRTLLTIPYDYSKTFHGVISCYNLTTRIKNFRATPSPFQVLDSSGIQIVDTIEKIPRNNYVNVGKPPNANRVVAFTFNNDQSMNEFGFNKRVYNFPAANQGSLVGNEGFESTLIPDSLLVELPNISINSYDGEQQRRRNILAVLPIINISLNKMSYLTDNPIYVDIDNKETIFLNYLTIRVLNMKSNTVFPIKSDKGLLLTLLLD